MKMTEAALLWRQGEGFGAFQHYSTSQNLKGAYRKFREGLLTGAYSDR